MRQLDAGVHQGQTAAADGGHRRRAVGFQDFGRQPNGERAIVGHHGPQSLLGQGAVSELSSAGAEAARLVGGVRRELVVKKKVLLFDATAKIRGQP